MKKSNCDVYVDSSSLASSIIKSFGITGSEIQNEKGMQRKKKITFIARGYLGVLYVSSWYAVFVNDTLLITKKPHGFPVTEKGENIGM